MLEMRQQLFVVAVLAPCLSLGGCRDHETRESGSAKSGVTATSKEPAPNIQTIRARVHSALSEFTFTLIADGASNPGDILRVKRIEIGLGRTAEPFQVIDGLDTETPVSADTPGIAVLDMNFDGYGDIRLVALRPAGPNTPYLNWLYNPTSKRFEESRSLNAITAPQFDAVNHEIHSQWRDGATRYGKDIYVYREDQPMLVRKEVKEYQGPGSYQLQVSRLVNGTWKVVEKRNGRDP